MKFQVNIEIQLNTARVSKLSFRFLWLWWNSLSQISKHLHSIQWRNWGGTLGAMPPSLRKNLLFLKEYKDKIILFGSSHFVEKFYHVFILFPAVEDFYCLSILMEIFTGTAIRIYNETFEENKCSILQSRSRYFGFSLFNFWFFSSSANFCVFLIKFYFCFSFKRK